MCGEESEKKCPHCGHISRSDGKDIFSGKSLESSNQQIDDIRLQTITITYREFYRLIGRNPDDLLN